MKVRTNLLTQRIASGTPLLGAYVSFPSPEVVEFCGLVGFDWVFLDAEHCPISVECCYALVRAADAVGIPSIVRVPINEPSVILAYVESGVGGVIAPHISSASAAGSLVRSTRYWPDGTRGASSTTRAAGYGVVHDDAMAYFAATDQHVQPIALLEDEAAFSELDAIAAVPGVDIMFFGAGDLAMSMGLPGQVNHPRVRELIGSAVPVLRQKNKVLGTVAGSPSACKEAIQQGFQMITLSIGALLAASVRAFLAEVKDKS